MIALDQLERSARLGLVLIVPSWIVTAAAARNLVGGQAEQEEVIFAGGGSHLDRRTVAGTDRERAVHHELHVARAARLVPRRRDLLRDVARGYQPLRDRHGVVRHENDLQAPSHREVAVDGPGEIVDELYDE